MRDADLQEENGSKVHKAIWLSVMYFYPADNIKKIK